MMYTTPEGGIETDGRKNAQEQCRVSKKKDEFVTQTKNNRLSTPESSQRLKTARGTIEREQVRFVISNVSRGRPLFLRISAWTLNRITRPSTASRVAFSGYLKAACMRGPNRRLGGFWDKAADPNST